VSRSVDPEETAALAVLAELGRQPGSEDTRVTSAEDEVEDVLRRLDLEAIGLLAYGLEPVAPRPAVREELLARLSGDTTQEVAPVAPAADVAPAPAQAQDAAAEQGASKPKASAPGAGRPAAIWPELAAEKNTDSPRPTAPAPVVGIAERAAARRPRGAAARWLAAVFALAAVGAGGWGIWLSSELSSDRARLARLERDLAQTREQGDVRSGALAARLAELEQRAEFVSGPAALVFALRPPASSPQPLARAKLWVAGDHQHWQLDAAGLAACPDGREYQVWFLVDGVPINGGTFKVEKGQRMSSLGSARMPAGTNGVSITLERAGGVPVPNGPVLLLADQAVEL
jgi:hypothetical protein